MNSLHTQLNELGAKMAVVPVECLADINKDFNRLKNNNQFGKLQNWVMDNYVLNDSGLGFKPRSIVLAAMPNDLKKITFNYQGKQIEDILNVWPSIIKDITLKIFEEYGYQISYKYWLPVKRLAVRAGLCDYGRNNITYIKGWGSFFEHASFFSDIDPGKNYLWRNVKCLDACSTCKACINACPTKAILRNRFLINPDSCISNFNEHGTEPFPDFIPKTAHRSLVGCLHCQEVCPFNQDVLKSITDRVEFDEPETAMLLKGLPIEKLPEKLKAKIKQLKMTWFYQSIPRNLRALLYNAV